MKGDIENAQAITLFSHLPRAAPLHNIYISDQPTFSLHLSNTGPPVSGPLTGGGSCSGTPRCRSGAWGARHTVDPFTVPSGWSESDSVHFAQLDILTPLRQINGQTTLKHRTRSVRFYRARQAFNNQIPLRQAVGLPDSTEADTVFGQSDSPELNGWSV
jgi:hypothetical protein